MLSKHIDFIAIALIALGMLAFRATPQRPIIPTVSAADFRLQNGRVDRPATDTCPLTRALHLVFR